MKNRFLKQTYVLLGGVCMALCSHAYGMVDEHYISSRVSHEVKRQMTGGGAPVASAAQATSVCYQPKPACGLYQLPHWPAYSLFFEKGDLVQTSFDVSLASQAYSPHGKTRDMSNLVFGFDPITVSDLLLVTRLIGQDKLLLPQVVTQNPSTVQLPIADFIDANGRLDKNSYYLNFLAGQQFQFDASQDDYKLAFDYARSFRCGRVTIGVHLPVILRHHRLRLTNDLSAENLAKIRGVENNVNAYSNLFLDASTHEVSSSITRTINFFENYNGLEDFLEGILSAKGISFNQKGTRLGVSDMQVYANMRLKTRYWDRGLIGVMLQLPTARDRDNTKLWPTEFGNGGFVELSGYTSLFWQVTRWFNPYVHARFTYSFNANVNRRVPKVKSYYGDAAFNSSASAYDVVLGQNVSVKVLADDQPDQLASHISWSGVDTLTKGFADQQSRFTMHRGPEFFARLGMQVGPVFSCHGAFDLYYDFDVKGKDYARNRKSDDSARPSIMTQGSWSIMHKIGGAYSHQFDDTYRFGIGTSYVFAGRNTPKSFGIDTFLNVEF